MSPKSTGSWMTVPRFELLLARGDEALPVQMLWLQRCHGAGRTRGGLVAVAGWVLVTSSGTARLCKPICKGCGEEVLSTAV